MAQEQEEATVTGDDTQEQGRRVCSRYAGIEQRGGVIPVMPA